ncbi:MAG: hypothetical protein EOO62_00895 [Hymenobacter sp.]|nr:MAG: hypothetical protein EOO62_00895 [Hymenobacter sp.]
MHTFTSRFVWASHDGYPAPAVEQTGWAYSVYLLAGKSVFCPDGVGAWRYRVFPPAFLVATTLAAITFDNHLPLPGGVATYGRSGG